MDMIHAQEDTPLSFLERLQIIVHLFFCADCSQKAVRLERSREFFANEFLPPSPGLETQIMEAVSKEEEVFDESHRAGFSLGGWVIAGLIMLFSLATIFFGMDFNRVALAAGMSFMIPIGITIGTALTVYGAFFISSHLKELSQWLGLENKEAG